MLKPLRQCADCGMEVQRVREHDRPITLRPAETRRQKRDATENEAERN